MDITEEQKAAISRWIEEGVGLPEIQKRLKDELGIALTYFETRMLADDLKLQLKEPERPAEVPKPEDPLPDAAMPGKLSMTIDQITRPGAMVSGRVNFSDGEKAEWSIDQTGRLALNPATPGYRPSQKDVMDFQVELERAVRSQGL